MKFVIAMMKHETNTFSPVPTPLARFGPEGPSFGLAAQEAFTGTGTAMGAFLDLAKAHGIDIVTPVAGDAHPSGPVDTAAYQTLTDAICDAVADGCDAVLLDLHGAMVSETTDDGEGSLLERLRTIAPEVPIGVALDLHTNLTARMVGNCTAMVGYKTYPHVDMYEAGKHVGEIIVRSLNGEVTPVMAWDNRPILAHTLCMGTDDAPMKGLVTLAREAETATDQSACLAATVFGGFPMADIEQAGVSAVVVCDGDRHAAEAVCEKLLDTAWQVRGDFIYASEHLENSVARAKRLGADSDGAADHETGPILLIDHADNCASGGTQDTMAVLAEVMAQDLKDVAVGAIVDPDAVDQMITAGVGATITLELGGKTDMPMINQDGQPLLVTGTVRAITDGNFIVRGPMYTGVRAAMGKTVVLDTGKVEIVVISRNHEPYDLGIFRSVGIEPTTKRFLLLKSRIHYRAGFASIASNVVECAGVGVTSSDYSLFTFNKVRRPIIPLDDI